MAEQNCFKPMMLRQVVILVLYLLFATTLTGSAVYSLWSLQPKASKPEPQSGATAGEAGTNCRPGEKRLAQLLPNAVGIGSPGEVQILGCGFTDKTKVKFNGSLHSVLYVDPGHIRLPLTSSDVASGGSYAVTLFEEDADASPFGTGEIRVTEPLIVWTWLGRSKEISLETQLLLLVIFMGAFGSSVYALKSLADYKGDEKLGDSWLIYFLIQPFEGSGIAVLFYLVIRGGFLTGTGVDMNSVNQFGICAIAGLAGAFSDTAFMKLREVFMTLSSRGILVEAKGTNSELSRPCCRTGIPPRITSKTLRRTMGFPHSHGPWIPLCPSA